MNRKTLNWIADALTGTAIAGLVLGAYIAWPYWSAHQLRRALENGDTATLSHKVEWTALRTNFKESFGAVILHEISKLKANEEDSDQIAAGLMATVGPAVLNGMVDAYITPQGVITLFNNANKSDQGGATKRLRGEHIKSAGFVSFIRFEIEIGEPSEKKGAILAVMELTGFDWKLTNLILKEPLGSLLKTPTL